MVSVLAVVACCAGSAAFTALICSFATAFGNTFKLIDNPDGGRKRHLHTMPLMGGIAVFCPTLALSLLYAAGVLHNHFLVVALLVTFVTLMIGIADDRHDLSPRLRMGAFIALILGVLSFEPFFALGSLRFVVGPDTLQLHFGILAVPITVLLIVGFVNAANMADGINGQLLGSLVIWSLFIAYHLGLKLGIPYLILATSAGVAFFFNLRSKLFSGSAGAYAGALIVGLGAIAAFHYSNDQMSPVLPLLWFWLPVVDCVRLMIARPLKRRSPFAADRGHFHHNLLERCSSGAGALVIYLSLLAAPGIVAEINIVAGLVTLVLALVAYGTLLWAYPIVTVKTSTLDAKANVLGANILISNVAGQRQPIVSSSIPELTASSVVAMPQLTVQL